MVAHAYVAHDAENGLCVLDARRTGDSALGTSVTPALSRCAPSSKKRCTILWSPSAGSMLAGSKGMVPPRMDDRVTSYPAPGRWCCVQGTVPTRAVTNSEAPRSVCLAHCSCVKQSHTRLRAGAETLAGQVWLQQPLWQS